MSLKYTLDLINKTILLLFIVGFQLPMSGQVSGRIVDKKDSPLAFAVVYDETYKHTTVTNENGDYQLDLSSGSYTLYFQLLGYVQQKRAITISPNKNKQELNVTLIEDTYELPELTILSGEDPAMPIIRNAIKNKSKNKQPKEDYTAQVYGKGFIKMLEAPKKVLGQSIGTMGGILDSTTRQGILYLSETVSEVSYLKPDQYYEKVLASKVSGDGSGISINSFARSTISMYDETTDFSRGIASPIADNALSLYKYRLIATEEDEKGNKIHRIKVMPKSKYNPSYSGEIRIVDGTYHIYAVDLYTDAFALKSSVIDTLHIMQVYKPKTNADWYIISQNIEFKAKVFGFKMGGFFNYIFLDHNFEIKPIIKNKSEVLKFDKTANTKDSSYWNQIRPITLTDDEERDYVKKDSLSVLWKSKPFLDSLDRRSNKFNLGQLFFGYNGRNRYKKISYGMGSPIYIIQFNAVEGWNMKVPLYYSKRDSSNDAKLNINGVIGYGFSDQRLKLNTSLSYVFSKMHLVRGSLSFGRINEHFDHTRPISDFANSFNSLWFKRNFAKYYDRTYIKSGLRGELFNGLVGEAVVAWEQRKNLQNTSQSSWRRLELIYSPNNITESPEYTLNSKLLLVETNFRIRIGQKYMSYIEDRQRIRSAWPDLYVQLYNAIPIDKTYADFTKLKLRMEKMYIPLRTYGTSSFILEYGKFLRSENVTDVDLFHFQGNELATAFASNYLHSFRLMPYYQFSSTKPYVAFFHEHHFDGFLTDKIPFINRSSLKLVSNIATLIRADNHHTELGLGLEGFSIGVIDLFRLDYVWSFGLKGHISSGIKVGLGDIFRRDSSF